MAFNLKLPAFSKAGQSGETDAVARRLPVIGRFSYRQRLVILGGGMLISLLAGIGAAVLDNRATSYGAHYIELSGNLLTLTQRLAKDAGSALQGKQTAIEGLPSARADAEHILAALDKGDSDAPPLGGNSRVVLEKLIPVARKSLGYIKDIETGQAAILAVTRAVDMGQRTVPLLRDDLVQLSLSGENGVRAAKLSVLLERINIDASALLGGTITTEHFGILEARLDGAEELMAALEQANPAAMSKVTGTFNEYRDVIRAIVNMESFLITAKQGSGNFFDTVSYTKNGPFLAGTRELEATVQNSLKGRWTNYTQIISAVLLLAFMGLMAAADLADARMRAAEADRVNKRNQNAILRLMNELGDLADGDLTVRATVTEDITGSIADSVNYTTEELQKLVSRVVAAAEQMGRTTVDAESISRNLLDATQKQAREIQEAGESVQLMSRSIQEVDAAASKAAEVGRHTLETTSQGAQAVHNTISGMDGIREQIQETSKRIKRLGESSQEIGEIVDMISDITEQTNVLALNAAIQAVSAGEAGRGFSVVAEEVQRLAERSAEATRKISTLVKTIQSDTQDAVAAMEKSTLGVVEGAKLSDMAGQSLKEIGQVSNELAALIDSISVSTQMQTDMAGEVASAMQDILKITGQTTAGTRQTAHSVTQLATIASDLKGSVAGFKL